MRLAGVCVVLLILLTALGRIAPTRAQPATPPTDAARVRFRPIIMTSFAFILGVVALVTSTGAGAAADVSLGLAVFSGMIASTCLALLFVRRAATAGGADEAAKAEGSRARTGGVTSPSPPHLRGRGVG